jgi:hypothetical protein
MIGLPVDTNNPLLSIIGIGCIKSADTNNNICGID